MNNDISVGIDFGTTNTVVAIADSDGPAKAIKFNCSGQMLHVYMSALCFWEEHTEGVLETFVEGGPWAVEHYLEGIGSHRFIQSFKTYAASRSFQETWIYRKKFRFEDLLATFLRTLFRHTDLNPTLTAKNVVIGRPVRFAGRNPDDGLAMERYRNSFASLGMAGSSYVYEPVAAAFFFAQRIRSDATILVADFGGGTSDFSVIRFVRKGASLKAHPLGNAGIGIAGDAFDYRIIDNIVSPKLGKGAMYRSFDKILPMPNGYFSNFARWNQLATMKSSGELKQLKELARLALEAAPILKFINIIENDFGFALYDAVSAFKIALSSREQVDFTFKKADLEIFDSISRREFESWIARDVAKIAHTVDEAISKAEISPSKIDRVFLTGGSSFIPAIQKIFFDRFSRESIVTGDQFESIAYGLATIGRSPNLPDWEVQSF